MPDILKTGWKPMSSAPRDGTTIVVVFHEWNNSSRPQRLAAAWWMCNEQGDDWCWRASGRFGTTQFADGWLLPSEYAKLAHAAKAAAEPSLDFDL